MGSTDRKQRNLCTPQRDNKRCKKPIEIHVVLSQTLVQPFTTKYKRALPLEKSRTAEADLQARRNMHRPMRQNTTWRWGMLFQNACVTLVEATEKKIFRCSHSSNPCMMGLHIDVCFGPKACPRHMSQFLEN